MSRALAVLVVALAACHPTTAPAPQAPGGRLSATHADSRVDPARAQTMHRLLEATRAGDGAAALEPATDRLRDSLTPEALQTSLLDLTSRFGPPIGILEEHVHQENDTRWYSALVLHGEAEGDGVVTPVLYQFSLDDDDRLDTLLVREHWFIENLEHPAEAYVPVTRFHLPARGTWYVLHGGRARATNYHHGNRNQRWAYDLVVKRDGRQRPRGSDRHRNDSFYAHGEDLLAPAAGTVVHVVEGVPENRPPERGRAGGNGLIIDHGFGEFSAMWHAIPGSLEVGIGDRVETGQRVAKVGNSGRSTGPHIHWHVSYRPPGKPNEEVLGLPADMTNVYVDDTWYEHKMPVRGQYVRPAVRPKITVKPVAAGPRVFVDL